MADNAIDYTAIRARLDAATPGPWVLDAERDVVARHNPYDREDDYPVATAELPNAELIAHSRTDLEQLLDRVEEQNAILAAVQTLCDNAPHLRDPWEDDWQGDQVVTVERLRAALAAGPAAGEEKP